MIQAEYNSLRDESKRLHEQHMSLCTKLSSTSTHDYEQRFELHEAIRRCVSDMIQCTSSRLDLIVYNEKHWEDLHGKPTVESLIKDLGGALKLLKTFDNDGKK